jgi:hypothetical protein
MGPDVALRGSATIARLPIADSRRAAAIVAEMHDRATPTILASGGRNRHCLESNIRLFIARDRGWLP